MPKPTAPPCSVGQARVKNQCGYGMRRSMGCAKEGPHVVPHQAPRLDKLLLCLLITGACGIVLAAG